MRLLALTLAAAVPLFGGDAVQTDWSGGSSSGTVSEWTDTFSGSEQIAWMSIPGQLQLSSVPVSPATEHQIASGIDTPYSACISDLNGDGFNDLICGSSANDGLYAWYGSESGTWTEQKVSDSTPSIAGLDTGDFDGDGLTDIAATAGTEVHLFLNGGETVPSWQLIVPGSGYTALHDVEAVDLDLDGDLDIVAADYDGDRLFWLRNDSGSWSDLTIDTVIDYPCKPHSADINGDGNMDVVCSAWTGGKVWAFYGSGGSDPSWTSQIIDPACVAAHGTRACDMDSDGDLDVVAASINGSRLYLYRNDGASSPSWTRETLGIIAGTAMVRVGDIDGDGDPDAIASSWGNAGVAWWENTENGTVFVKHVVKTGGSATSWAFAGDVDNDGDLDVISVRYQQGSLYWYEVTEFLSSGSLESQILDTQDSPEWASFEWNADIPEGCTISMQFRSSDDPGALGEWSGEYFSSSELSGLVKHYFQYRINMISTSPATSPVLKEFSLHWDTQGIESGSLSTAPSFSNPSCGNLSITIPSEAASPLFLSVHSIAGRVVHSDAVAPGEIVNLEGLHPGLFLVSWHDGNGCSGAASAVITER